MSHPHNIPVRLLSSIIVCLAFLTAQVNAQGSLAGNLETRAQFFIRDSTIGAANTPQYDHQLYGSESWLSLLYNNWGFTIGIRFDLFHQSNLFNPQGSYSDQGIGRWFIEKKIAKLNIAAGYIYDQIGTGIIFRSYEERALGIDNALTGLKLAYNIHPNWTLKGFTGKQKNRFALYNPIIKGFSLDGYVSLGKISITPGVGITNRTLDDPSMNSLIATLNTYEKPDQFIPKYNTYAYTVFNTLYAGSFTWYIETAAKSKDAMNDPVGTRIDGSGNEVKGNTFIQKRGSVLYSSLNYAAKGLGISLEVKRTRNFTFRVRPQVSLNDGLLNFLPPMTRQNSYRLTTLYTAATQELGEQAIQFEFRKKISERWKTTFHVSYVENLEGDKLYNEWLWENLIAKERVWRLVLGIQLQNYNQQIYELKPGVPSIRTITPYLEYLRTYSQNKSIRFETQLMITDEDRGSWVHALLELGWAPRWLVTFSNMYNIGKNGDSGAHYYTAGCVYQVAGNRFNLSYVRQVEGIVCAGGICRFEPAFNGMKLGIISNF